MFEGRLTRLVARNTDTDVDLIVRWELDTEFFRLYDSDPVYPRLPKQRRERLEQHDDGRPDFLIRTVADDTPIGLLGFNLLPAPHGDAFMYVGIGERAYWGKGYGVDAINVGLRYVFEELSLHRVSLGVFEYNARAIRAYEKIGFVHEGTRRDELVRNGRRWGVHVMGILAREWRDRNPS